MVKPNLSVAAVTFLALFAHTIALVPQPRSIWDVMFTHDDPFKILEHSPLAMPRAADETSSSAGAGAVPTSIALARADWRETQTDHEITLDVPGMKKDGIRIEVEEEKRVLSVSGERKMEKEVKDERWHRVERTVGKFWRQFRLPENADMESVKARLVDGVLKITVTKLPEGARKREARVIGIDSSDEKGKEEIVNLTKQELR